MGGVAEELVDAVEPIDEAPDGIALRLESLRLAADARRAVGDLERRLVVGARRAGCSWREIGAALGVSRQAAHRRFRGVDPRRRSRDPEDELLADLTRRLEAGEVVQHLLTGPGPGNGG